MNILSYVLGPLLSIPLAFFLVIALGWLLRSRRPRLGRALVVGGAGGLVLASSPWCSALLLKSLQTSPALEEPAAAGGEAIVILSADAVSHAPELGGPTVGRLTLERLRYGALLARELELPVLVAGGSARPHIASRASLMAEVLENELGVPVRWIEGESVNTLGNARRARARFEAAGIERVLLVTHAWHMPRARAAFASTGLDVVPAPTAFRDWPDVRLATLAPSARSLQESAWAVHEWIGRLWYLVRTGRW